MAFPSSSILDGFDRANEGPPPSANWTSGIDGSAGSFTVTGNVAQATSGTFSSAYWNVENFGPDVEAHLKMTDTVSGGANGIRIYFRVLQEGTAGFDGYMIQAYARTDLYVYRIDNGSQTQLGTPISQAYTDGDSIGVTMIGDTITVYFKSGAGSWASVGTRTDSTYTAAGKLAIASFDSTGIKIDDFGGGTAITEVAVGPALFRGRNFPLFDDEEVNRFEFWPSIISGGGVAGPVFLHHYRQRR